VSLKTPQKSNKMTNEIKYETTNNSDRGQMQGYHRSPSPRELQKSAKQSDIANLKSKCRKNITQGQIEGDFDARFTIGMEVEKNRLHRNAVKEYPLFAGFESDSSCGETSGMRGYEAITNILPLLPKGKWRNKVFNMMFEASKIIEDEHSPSNHRCGGHITLAVDGLSGTELMQKMRKNVGIVYSLFHKRISNYYCCKNLTMQTEGDSDDWMGGDGRYSVCLNKGQTIEFRLISRFQSVKQMMRRYELMYEVVDFSVNNPNGNFNSLLKKVTPIVKSMYNGDMDKVAEKLELAKAFQKMVNTNKVNRAVVKYVDPMNRMNPSDWFDADLRRNGRN